MARLAELRPDWINDPRRRDWEAEVEPTGVLLRPRWSDERFAYRVADIPAASHPTIAAALARLLDPRPGELVWDPFAGSACELIECHRRAPGARLLATDRDPRALAAARANLAAAAVSATIVEADALIHRPAGLRHIVTNPPLGRRVRLGEDLGAFLCRFLDHAARVLPAGGRLAWISARPGETARHARALGLEVVLERRVDLGGFAGTIQVFARRGP